MNATNARTKRWTLSAERRRKAPVALLLAFPAMVGLMLIGSMMPGSSAILSAPALAPAVHPPYTVSPVFALDPFGETYYHGVLKSGNTTNFSLYYDATTAFASTCPTYCPHIDGLTIDYGPTGAFGSVYTFDNHGTNLSGTNTPALPGFVPHTLYHFRITVYNETDQVDAPFVYMNASTAGNYSAPNGFIPAAKNLSAAWLNGTTGGPLDTFNLTFTVHNNTTWAPTGFLVWFLTPGCGSAVWWEIGSGVENPGKISYSGSGATYTIHRTLRGSDFSDAALINPLDSYCLAVALYNDSFNGNAAFVSPMLQNVSAVSYTNLTAIQLSGIGGGGGGAPTPSSTIPDWFWGMLLVIITLAAILVAAAALSKHGKK